MKHVLPAGLADRGRSFSGVTADVDDSSYQEDVKLRYALDDTGRLASGQDV